MPHDHLPNENAGTIPLSAPTNMRFDAHDWLRPRTVIHPAGARLTGAAIDATGRTISLHRTSSSVATTSTSDERACIHGQQRIHLITGPLAGLWVPEDANSHFA